MGSIKGKGRNQGRDPRRGTRSRQFDFLKIESLEDRVLLSPATIVPTTTNLADIQNGPMANAGQDLIEVYQAYLSDGSSASTLANQFNTITFQNGSVGIDTKWNGSGDFTAYTSALTNLGMQVNATSATDGLVEGFLPVAQLPTVAEDPQTLSLTPIYTPVTHFVGVADNEGETALQAPAARQTFGVDGTGVTIGVLSDSVNQAANPAPEPPGLAGSVQSGDLPSNVNVLQDGVAGDTDEGRAMLEGIHDIAPGAGLAFATADGGDLAFANNIDALQSQAKASVIVDDISYLDEPFFQDGLVSQAVDTVTANGATYLSAAGNAANEGYLSQFRGTQATVGSLGAGTFMNFAPSGAATTELPITVSAAGTELIMQFDQPFAFQEPVGDTNVVTSQVNFYVLNAAGAVVAQSVSNNVMQQEPLQDLTINQTGNFFVVIQLVSGPAPGHVEFLNPGDAPGLIVSHQFGSAGGTSYPTTFGHASAANTIGVGAVPWWAAPPYLDQTPLNSEPFSSFGPSLIVFNPDGSLMSTPQVVENPVVSGPDGGNTSFFPAPIAQNLLNTTNPPNPGEPATPISPALPGEPATTTNLAQPNLPAFFGTSQAAPNVAAIVALMKQVDPSATPAVIRGGLIASAEPLNGAAPGTWDPQGGFGYVNAPKALAAVNTLRVLTVTPISGAVTSLSPGTVTITFNRPVNFSTISASDLSFTGLPANVSVSVGTPIAVDNPQFPTVIAFPITITLNPGAVLANGLYSYVFQGPVVGEDGTSLTPFSGSFNLQATDGPQILNTTVTDRVITVQFNEGLQPSTINANTFQLVRLNGASSFAQPGNVVVTADPLTQFIYNPVNDTVSIDLSQLPQSELPTDQYELVVFGGSDNGPTVLDQAGLMLDGEFSGFFPSGNGVAGGTFVQLLGVQTLLAPQVSGLKLDPGSDSGILGDENTNITTPLFDGQVSANFPGTLANLTVLAEFSSLHGGDLDLSPGPNGRGFIGSFDVTTQTDANGHFTIQAPALFEGYQTVRIVVVGDPDLPPQAGLSSSFDHSFRIDTTAPFIGLPSSATPGVPLNAVSLTPGGTPLPLSGTNLASLSTLSLNVVDPASPPFGALATPPQILFPAMNPTTADNLGNYTLLNTTTGVDESQFIESANYVSTDATFGAGTTPGRTSTSDPFTGRIDLNFAPGLPAGAYTLVAHSGATATGTGLTDAAGNPMDNTAALGTKDFTFSFSLQSEPVYITNLSLVSTYVPTTSATQTIPNLIGGPRSYFEEPAANAAPQAPAPPSAIIIDFSTPLNPNANYTNLVQLIGSADGPGASPDGDFGTLGEGGLGSTGSGFTVVSGTTVTLVDPTGKLPGDPGFSGTRLVLQLAPGTTLASDYYRLYIPNSGSSTIDDIFGNQLDGEFLGNLTAGNNYIANASFDGYTASPTTATGNYLPPVYEDLIANDIVNGVSQYRQQDLSGDGVAGGAFMTAFTVVPNGNVIYARPDYVEDPLNPATYANGTLAKPYPVLAPQASATALNGGDLNAPSNFFNFNPADDLAGIGHFASSAIYAAQVLSAKGPVIIVALPATPQRDPVTGAITEQTFVLQSSTDGSASVPFDTTLVFDPSAILKLQNATLFVQNQGSALQALGSNNTSDHVIFTSLNDNTAGGVTNGNTTASPHGGDWGGIVFRNYDESANNVAFPVDGTLQGPNNLPAVSGADDLMSFLNFAEVRYAGGAVPAANGIRYDAITLFNSRPTLTNDNIYIPNGNTNGAGAAISADLDSFREDDVASGPLIRTTNVANYSLNGIWVRPNLTTGLTGVAEQTTAIAYPVNPTTLGGNTNFAFNDPLPYILTSLLIVGEELLVNTGGQTTFVNNRLYIDPGVIVKSNSGAGIAVVNNDASINIGSRTYMNQYDANPNFNYTSPNFQSETMADAGVVFTSLFDYDATSPLIPNRINSPNDALLPNGNTVNQPDPLNSVGSKLVKLSDGSPDPLAEWGSIGIQSGAVAVVNDAYFFYGGWALNGPTGSLPSQSVLSFITSPSLSLLPTPLSTSMSTGRGGFASNPLFSPLAQLGTHAIVTNNDFFDNLDTPIQIEPNGLLAADPTRPLESGNPFFKGNLLQRNDIDGLGVVTNRNYVETADQTSVIRPQEIPLNNSTPNLTVNSVWDLTDITYVLRGTVVLSGYYDNQSFFNAPGVVVPPPAPVPGTPLGQQPTGIPVSFVAEELPDITLTIQSTLPGTVLADGSVIPSPGAPVVVKLLNDYAPWDSGAANLATTYGSTGDNANTGASENGGAGFIVGVDDDVDPPSTTGSNLVDPGAGSQIRILGIGGNESTGQQRVPVIMTSLKDGSVGVTVRGIQEYNIYNADPLFQTPGLATFNPNYSTTTPQAGDGGYIYYGGNSLTDMNLLDPRDGSLIDNANISYMTRIEIQGGGIVDMDSTAVTTGFQSFLTTKLGQTPATQYNSDMALTISDSNLANFADAAVFVHPDAGNALIRDLGVLAIPGTNVTVARSAAQKGEGVVLFMLNDTISNSGVGIQANSDTVAGTGSPSPIELVLLNNTFYNDPIGLHTIAPVAGATVPLNDTVYWLAMDNIFSNSSNTAIISDGQEYGSQAQYNLYWQNGANLTVNNPTPFFQGNFGAVFGDPEFVDAAAGNFQLMPDSAAIDAARSEIGPLPAGDAIYPTVTQVLNATGGIRTDPASLTPPSTPGRSDPNGGNSVETDPRKQVTLPGTPGQTFIDEWTAVLPTAANAVLGPASNSATFAYAPVTGERDLLGQFREDDPNVPNVGFGSRPFFDIGAYEFVQYFPPDVVPVSTSANVLVTLADGSTKDLYSVGGVSGVNQVPQSIEIAFNHPLDPSTITALSVLLVGSGGDGIFGNGNDVTFSLNGRLSYANTASGSFLTINTAGLNLPTDEYEITLEGSGSNVIKDLQGNALDGEDTSNNDSANGVQQALPSGDGIPGGNFYLMFTLDTHAPSIVPGTFVMSAATDTNIVGDQITDDNTPSFTGQITDIFPPANPLLGDTVFLDVFNQSTGQWVQVGQSTTNATGNFTVAVSSPLPNTQYNVGPDGILGTPDDTGYDEARVRIVDQAGNASNLFTDPLSAFVAAGAATSFVVDTQAPTITAVSPTPNSLVTTSPVTVSFTADKTLDQATVNATSVLLFSPGAGGAFSTPVPLTNVGFTFTPLKNGQPLGPEQVSFNLPAGLPNNQYEVVLTGAGATPITDIAGNPLNGSGTPGSNFTFQFVVDNAAATQIIFAGPASSVTSPAATLGSRENPFPTISAAIAVATLGDFVAVLPGTYTENITLTSLIRVLSASMSSTDTSFQPGSALNTVIRAPIGAGAITVTANNLISVPGLFTELGGFSIVSPLIGSQASGTLDPTSVGVSIVNSNVLIDKDYIINAGLGVSVTTTGINAATPTIGDDVIDGNIFGIVINDAGTTSVQAPTSIYNNTIVDNTVGLVATVNPTSPILANIANNIFWENHDLTTARNGAAIVAAAPNKIVIQGNLFSGNGASETSQAGTVLNAGGDFNPAVLGPTPDALGNFTGNPAFVQPRDARPGADGPGEFFQDANFDLTSASAAIDAALPALELPYDFLYRSRVRIPGRGFPGTGPGDVGAFEYKGTGGVPVGGAFRVASTSLAPGGAALAAGSPVSVQQLGNAFVVDFSQAVDPSTVNPSELVLSGSGLNATDPAHATSLTWIDAHTVEFMLSGSFNSSGTVTASIANGAVQSVNHQPLLGFTDSAQVTGTTSTPASTTGSPSTPATSTSPSPTAQTPAPASAPTAPGKHHAKAKHSKPKHSKPEHTKPEHHAAPQPKHTVKIKHPHHPK